MTWFNLASVKTLSPNESHWRIEKGLLNIWIFAGDKIQFSKISLVREKTDKYSSVLFYFNNMWQGKSQLMTWWSVVNSFLETWQRSQPRTGSEVVSLLSLQSYCFRLISQGRSIVHTDHSICLRKSSLNNVNLFKLV